MPILIGVTLVTFCLFHLVGGDPALHYAGKNADQQTIDTLRQELGLDKPLASQYLLFLKKTVLFDWGRSWKTSESIGSMLASGIVPTLLLTVPAFLISIYLSILLSLMAAYKRGAWDRAIVIGCLSSMSISFLVYIVVLQKWLAFDFSLFPVYGWNISEALKYLLLPWLIYILATLGPKILLFRSALLEEASHDYVRTARAKGLSEWKVYTRHILKNASLPMVTLSLAQMPALITGSLLLEAYFGIPGLGLQLAEAIRGSDFPVIQAMTVMGSTAYVVFNLLNDVICAYLDPRTELR